MLNANRIPLTGSAPRRGLSAPLAVLFAALVSAAVVVPAHAQSGNSKTALTPVATMAKNTKHAEEALALTSAQRVWVQQGLNELKFDVGAADGVLGPRTRAAIARWQSARGEPATGYLDAQAAELLIAVGKAISPSTSQTVGTSTATGTLNEASGAGDNRSGAGKPASAPKAQAAARQKALNILNEALALTPNVGDAVNRARVLAEIARVQAEAGGTSDVATSLSEALSSANKINNHWERAERLAAIARVQVAAGDTPGATRTISRALSAVEQISDDDSFMAPITLSAIAEAQAAMGEIQSALSTVGRIGDSTYRVRALARIAERCFEAGDTASAALAISKALSAVRSVPRGDARSERLIRSFERVQLLSSIAPAQAKTGDTLGAARSISEALSHAGDSDPDVELSTIAPAQAEIGDISGALSTVRRIGDAWKRADALVGIGRAQQEAGDSVGATRSISEAVSAAAQGSGGDWERSFLFFRIAEAQAAMGETQSALSTANSLGDASVRGAVLERIAVAQAEAGDIAGGLATARKRIDKDSRRVSALIDIARVQMPPAKAKPAKPPENSIARNQLGNEFGQTSTTGRSFSLACSSPVIFEGEGTVVLPSVDIVRLPAGPGTVTLEYEAFDVPDRFVVEVNGQINIDTQYVGSSSYTVAQVNRVLDHYGFRRTSQPSIITPGHGTRSFQKSTGANEAVVRIYAPLTGTRWKVTLRFHDSSCPAQSTGQAPPPSQALPESPGSGGQAIGVVVEPAAPSKPFGPNWIVVENQPCQIWNPDPVEGETATWTGGCVDGKASGRGRTVWKGSYGTSTYEGARRAGKKHGLGTYTWSDGSRYEGDWRDDKKHGLGTYTWPDGSRYEGDWRDDKPHGRGVYVSNGRRYEGAWTRGCFGSRSGRWAAVITTAKACGFE